MLLLCSGNTRSLHVGQLSFKGVDVFNAVKDSRFVIQGPAQTDEVRQGFLVYLPLTYGIHIDGSKRTLVLQTLCSLKPYTKKITEAKATDRPTIQD